MTLDLSSRRTIRTSLFVRIDIPDYGVEKFSNHHKVESVDDPDGTPEEYTNLGSLLSITSSTTELRASKTEVSIAISGIPAANVAAVNASNIKGSSVIIKRGISEPNGILIGEPTIKFQGIVNNIGFSEDYDNVSGTSSFTLTIICTSAVNILAQKVAGRRTNPADEKKFYPSDKSMNRVPNIKNSSFNFGAPPQAIRIGTK